MVPSPPLAHIVRRLASAIAALALLTAHPPAAYAVWPHPPGTQVLLQSVGVCWETKSVPDGAGGAYVVWVDTRNGTKDVFAQRVNADGVPLWTANGVTVCAAAGDQSQIAVTTIGADLYVVWSDRRGTSADIFTQKLTPGGSPVWTAGGVPVVQVLSPNDEISPDIGGNGASLYVVWQDGTAGSWNVYAQRMNYITGLPIWTARGVPVSTAAGDQTEPRCAVPTNTDRMYVTWTDARANPTQVYVKGVSATGTDLWIPSELIPAPFAAAQTRPRITIVGPGESAVFWTDARAGGGTPLDIWGQRLDFNGFQSWGSGIGVMTGAGDQFGPELAGDGAGGVYVAGFSGSPFGFAFPMVTHVTALGFLPWGSQGFPLTQYATGVGDGELAAVPDGANGVILAWDDRREFQGGQVFAQRIAEAGYILWTGGGAKVASNIGANGARMGVAPDGAGGAIVSATTVGFATYAKHIDRFGMLNADPTLLSANDLSNDQGGQVRLVWNASPNDIDPLFEDIESYWILRETPAAVAAQLLREGARLIGPEDAPPTDGTRALVNVILDGTAAAWEYLGSVPAFNVPQYSYVAATTSDSTGASNPTTAFLIQARNLDGSRWWFSDPVSGYSVDDLAPAAPAPFSGIWQPGGASLWWDANDEPDLAGYRLHRGTGPAFVPDAGNLVVAQAGTSYTDAITTTAWYKLAAVDAHGNISPYTTLLPTGALDAPGDGIPAQAWFAAPTPNPARFGTTARFGLPAAARVSFTIHDATGRLVREVADSEFPAGAHSVSWNGRDRDGAQVPSGVYFWRFETPGMKQSGRLARLR